MAATFVYTDSQNTVFDVPLIAASAIITAPAVNTNFVYTSNQLNNVYNGFTSVTRYTPNRYMVTNEQGYPVVTAIAPTSTTGATGATGANGLNGSSDIAVKYTFTAIAGQTVFGVVTQITAIEKVKVELNGVNQTQFTIANGGYSVNLNDPVSSFPNQIITITVFVSQATLAPIGSNGLPITVFPYFFTQ